MKIKKRMLALVLAVFLVLPLSGMGVLAALPPKYVGNDFRNGTTGSQPSITAMMFGADIPWKIEEFPSKEEKSLMISTENGGTSWYTDLTKTYKSNFVAETSIAYRGGLNSFKRIFTVDGPDGSYMVFFTLDSVGQLRFFNGEILTTVQEGIFTDITLMVDFKAKTASAKINGKTRVMDVPLGNDDFKWATNTRIQMADISGTDEKFYISYFRTYQAEGSMYIDPNDSSSNMPGGGTSKVTIKSITDDMVNERMRDYIFLTTKTGKALVNNEVKYVDEENKNVAPKIVKGRTLVPLRFVAESLGSQVNYNDITRDAEISFGGKTLVFNPSNSFYTNDGVSTKLDVPPVVENGRMLVPLRAVSEGLGKEVFYDKCGYIIIGDKASEFSLDNEKDKKILDKAVKPLFYESPTSEEVISLLKEKNPNNEHPRLFVRSEDIENIKEKVKSDELCAKWASNIITYADSMLNADPIPYIFSEEGPHLYSQGVAMERIEPLGFAYLLTGDKKYAEAAISNAMRMCDTSVFKDWHSYHALDFSETTYIVGLAFDWCYDVLTEEQKTTLKDSIIRNGLKEVLRDLNDDPTRERTWHWSSPNSTAYPQNWVAVCCGSNNLAALAIGDEPGAEEIAGDVISKGLVPIKDLLGEFAPDGAWFEGPSYWEYSMKYLVQTAASFDTALGTDFGLTNSPAYSEGPYYMIGNAGPAGCFNMNDCAQDLVDTPDFFWISDKLHDPALTKYRLNFVSSSNSDFRNLIWYNTEYANDSTPIAEDGMWREFMIASGRTGYDNNDLYVAIHGGEDGRNIGDLDYGEFIIDMFGKRWAKELGIEHANYVYGRQGERWDYYRSSGEGHNILVFNPDGGREQNKEAICPINVFKHNEYSMFAVTDLTEAYSVRDAESVVRGMYMNKADCSVMIQDEFKMKNPSEVYWFMHTDADVEIADDGRSAILTLEGNKMGVSVIGSDKFKFSVSPSVPMEMYEVPDDTESDDSNVNRLCLRASDVTEEKFAVKIYPLAGDEKSLTIEGNCTPISDWTLVDDSKLPKLTSLTVNGVSANTDEIKSLYSADIKFDKFIKASLEGVDVKAEGDGEVKIVPMTDDNRAAKIYITKDGVSRVFVVTVTNLSEKSIDFEQRKPDYVTRTEPAGLTELKIKSANAVVTEAGMIPENAIDGDFSTRWTNQTRGDQIVFDLGSVQDVSAFGIAFFFGNERSTYYRAAISEDGKDWTLIGNLKSSGTTLDLEVYKFAPQKARYLKLAGFGNTEGSDWFNIAEVRLYK